MIVLNRFKASVLERQGSVYIGRPGPFGNPFEIHAGRSRERAIERYKEYFEKRIEEDATFREAVHALYGKNLLCYCAPLPCHGQIIIDYLLARFENVKCGCRGFYEDPLCRNPRHRGATLAEAAKPKRSACNCWFFHRDPACTNPHHENPKERPAL